MRRIVAVLLIGAAVAAAAPARGPRKFAYVDVQPKANVKLTDNQGSGVAGNDLAALPTGEKMFLGVSFQVGPGLLQLGSKAMPDRPATIEGIPV